MKLALSRKNTWEHLPRPVKSAVGAALGKLPPSVFLGRRFRKYLGFVRDAQWWPADRVRALQLDQLKRICRLAYARTRFYRRLFDACGFDPRDLRAPEDISRLPTIDPQTVRLHLDEMCARSPRSWGVDYVSTGGTGGAPLHFFIGAERSAIEYAHLTAGWERAGYRLGTPMGVLRGRVVAENGDGVRHEFEPMLP